MLREFLRALFAELRRRVRRRWEVRPDQCGGVTFIQRFGSAMNLNLHFHTLALDGVYTGTVLEPGPPRFLPPPPPSSDEVARVLAGTARRVHRLIERRAADDEDAMVRDEPLLALLARTLAHLGGVWAIGWSQASAAMATPTPRHACPATAA